MFKFFKSSFINSIFKPPSTDLCVCVCFCLFFVCKQIARSKEEPVIQELLKHGIFWALIERALSTGAMEGVDDDAMADSWLQQAKEGEDDYTAGWLTCVYVGGWVGGRLCVFDVFCGVVAAASQGM